MSTRKNRVLILAMRIGWFALPVLLPLRCIHEIIEGFTDFVSLFKWVGNKWAGNKVYKGLAAAEAVMIAVKDFGPLDLVDVDVKNPDARVKVKILTR